MEMSLFQGLLNNIFITVGSCLLHISIDIAEYWRCNKNESLANTLARVSEMKYKVSYGDITMPNE